LPIKLHIVTWDVPFPADYGGAIDVYYKLKALHSLGIEIFLHCFEYENRSAQSDLEQYTKQVFYYPRKTGIRGMDFQLPYIVNSRKNPQLLKNLIKIDAPILFEGLHTTAYLNHPELKERFKIVRTHNIEHQYYTQLAGHTSSFLKKLFLYRESMLLSPYEKILKVADVVLTISEPDQLYFEKKYIANSVILIPAFHPENQISSLKGFGKYCLYHGNLSIAENEKAAVFLANEVFRDNPIPCIIAGKNPSAKLLKQINSQVEVQVNPDHHEMQHLIQNAHINILPAFQNTGIKLKLLHALFMGRHCLTNQTMVEGSILKDAVHLAEDAKAFREAIDQLIKTPFEESDLENRKTQLQLFDNQMNAQKIFNILQSHCP
jgi:hypothetical protein